MAATYRPLESIMPSLASATLIVISRTHGRSRDGVDHLFGADTCDTSHLARQQAGLPLRSLHADATAQNTVSTLALASDWFLFCFMNIYIFKAN